MIIEKVESRRFTISNKPSVTLSLLVTGSEDDLAVRNALAAYIPATYEGLLFQNYDLEHVGGGTWRVSVNYSLDPLKGGTGSFPGKPPNTGGGDQSRHGHWPWSTVSFDTTGATEHIEFSKEYRAYNVSGGGPPPQTGGLINVTEHGVQGVDIVVPKLTWSETHTLATVDANYILTLRDLTGTVNNDTFRSFPAEHVLFNGASGQRKGPSEWEITFTFTAARPTVPITVGGDPIPNSYKMPHEYLWIMTREVEDTDAQRVVRNPLAVFVHTVYPPADFSLLRIGT